MGKKNSENGAYTGMEQEKLEPDDIVWALNQALLKAISTLRLLLMKDS